MFAALIRGHYNESSDCFVYPKQSLLKSGHTKIYLQNFPTQKNPGIVVSTVEGEWDGNSELLDH